MKRIYLHIAFWVVYFLEDALLVNYWIMPTLKDLPQQDHGMAALLSAACYLIPKLIFTYFVVHFTVGRIAGGRGRLGSNILKILLMLVCCLVLYRLIANYFIYPVIYRSPQSASPLLDPTKLLIDTMDMGFVAGVMVAIELIRHQYRGREREKLLVREKLEAELKALRNQTNPHFLMNTLNNIYALARKKSDDTAEVVMKLSELLRFMLYESGGKFITLADEIKVLEDYLDLEMIRYNNRLSVSFIKETDEENYRIVPLLLLPFVENAFTHGISETRFESFLHIEIKAMEGRLHFVVENSKEKHSAENGKQRSGLSNVRRQLELTYREYRLDVSNEADHFKASLYINLNSHVEI